MCPPPAPANGGYDPVVEKLGRELVGGLVRAVAVGPLLAEAAAAEGHLWLLLQ